MSDSEKETFLKDLTNEAAALALYTWKLWARPEQLSPAGEWRHWLIQTGRGWGKTRTGAEWIRARVEGGDCRRLAIVAPTSFDVRHTCIEGESGILACCPPWDYPRWNPSTSTLRWKNGALVTVYSADEPDRLRGPQHDGYWADELAAWRYPDAWDQLMFGLRLGKNPRGVVTTTPRPVHVLRELIASDLTVVTRGSTMENAANLAPAFLAKIVERYRGTRIGRQELEGELLDELEGALWNRRQLDELRVAQAPEMLRVVVAIDPASTSKDSSDETGIIVGGRGVDKHGYVLADLSGRFTPNVWAKRAVDAVHTWGAGRIVAESNQGGEMIRTVIHNLAPTVSVHLVPAIKSKADRADPVASLYEQGRIHHVGTFPALEDQLCTWSPRSGAASPDRLDALVWTMTDLVVSAGIDWHDANKW